MPPQRAQADPEVAEECEEIEDDEKILQEMFPDKPKDPWGRGRGTGGIAVTHCLMHRPSRPPVFLLTGPKIACTEYCMLPGALAQRIMSARPNTPEIDLIDFFLRIEDYALRVLEFSYAICVSLVNSVF